MDEPIRIGRISSIDYKKGTAKVLYKDRDDMVTGDLPMLAEEYNMPKVDDLVLVLHTGKRRNNGVIIGRIYSDSLRPESTDAGKGKYYKKLTDSATIRVSEGEVTIDADSIKLKCSQGTISLAQIITHIIG